MAQAKIDEDCNMMPAKDTNTPQRNEEAIRAIRSLADKWPSGCVARSEIAKFTGGLLAPGTAANNDCLGTGIPGAFRVARKIAYPVDNVIEWLIAKLGEV